MDALAERPGASASSTPVVALRQVAKRYGAAVAVENIDLEIAAGEFFTFLGPSGSGKTTTLRLIAGFETPDFGRIELDGNDVARLPPYARNVNTVFQDYALFPHMTLLDNVAYGLRAKKIPAAAACAKATEALAMVRLEDFAARKPAQLSGGQRQRVALARAIVNRPRVLLLDEPLGALDLKLRHQMQTELKALQVRTGITFLYVTHDQEEALTMSDRVAVFAQGRIAQVGTPKEIYEAPKNAFVADFVGLSNIIRRDGRIFLLRPEKIRLLPASAPLPAGMAGCPAVIARLSYLGMLTRYHLDGAQGLALVAVVVNDGRPDEDTALVPGDAVLAAWHPACLRLLQQEI